MHMATEIGDKSQAGKDFPGSSVVKILPSSEGSVGLIRNWRTKIPGVLWLKPQNI